jgi:hypothetical protein
MAVRLSALRTRHTLLPTNIIFMFLVLDRLCDLVVRVLSYRFGGPGSIPGTIGIKKSKSPLSLVNTTEELLDRKVAAPV